MVSLSHFPSPPNREDSVVAVAALCRETRTEANSEELLTKNGLRTVFYRMMILANSTCLVNHVSVVCRARGLAITLLRQRDNTSKITGFADKTKYSELRVDEEDTRYVISREPVESIWQSDSFAKGLQARIAS